MEGVTGESERESVSVNGECVSRNLGIGDIVDASVNGCLGSVDQMQYCVSNPFSTREVTVHSRTMGDVENRVMECSTTTEPFVCWPRKVESFPIAWGWSQRFSIG